MEPPRSVTASDMLKNVDHVDDSSKKGAEKMSQQNSIKTETSNKVNKLPPKKGGDIPISYIVPEWSACPPPDYEFEVIKNGTNITDIPLTSSYIVIGRLDTCDITLEHPSVSRFHAVVQYCPGDDHREKGFYVYDLGSTHGTFLNKKQISAKVYCKIEVGHIVKFGGSTRLHIFHGPVEDESDESDKEETKEQAEMCTWGMGEDADEEDDLTVNPFALTNEEEELNLDDPKKALRSWFEREGHELEYDCEEKGLRTFVCRVQLPIDTPSGDYPFAEATVTGKKKEAVVACAMEACRILDRQGLLRKSHQESKRIKRKNWEDNDFYDSDEDTYLDRTGVIEKKREIRKKLIKKPEAETFQSLTEKLVTINSEVSKIEGKIQNCSVNFNNSEDNNTDSLELYMSQIEESSAVVDKVTKSRLKLQLSELLKEKSRLEKMLNVARPTALPPLVKTAPIIGKRPTKKFQLPSVAEPKKIENVRIKETEDGEELEEDSDDDVMDLLSEETGTSIHKSVKSVKETISTDVEFLHSTSTQKVAKVSLKATDVKNKGSKPAVKADAYKANESDYSMWVPPKNQTGDGSTHLNAKYGY